MTKQIRVGILCGSLKKSSINAKLANFVGKQLTSAGGVELEVIDLCKLDLPMFSEDINGLPASVNELKDQMIACDAFIVASPEYNGSMSGALKNAIDWASVGRDGDEHLACFKGKVCGLLSSSPGGIGGLQGLVHVRQILTRLQMLVVPAQYALGGGHEAFDDAGDMKDAKKAEMAMNVGREMVRVCRALKA
jgi:NAD(P)H-dependent FMN reductase